MPDLFSYQGKRVAIVGCYSGMGEACARELVRLGAEVHGADIREPSVGLASFTTVDLKDWASIDAAVDRIGGEIDALFNCAGLPQTFSAADVLSVNFLGIRHWTEQWLPRIRRGGAIGTISSLGGMGFLQRIALLKQVIAIRDKQEFLAWVAANAELMGDCYGFSKELINAWTSITAVELASRGIRMNATMPGPPQTPMMAAFEQVVSADVLGMATITSGRRATPEEQANALILLNSPAAAFVSGVCLPVDYGFYGGVTTGAIDVQAQMAAGVELATPLKAG
jgi:NAD(P)-dependent dehydrogenase (short-subunit alcohol dehydrogenase family)